MDDVKAGEHGGSEIVVLRGCRPVVGIGKHREDDLESVVAEFFERKKESLDAFLGSRVETIPKPLGVRIRSSCGMAWSMASAVVMIRQ